MNLGKQIHENLLAIISLCVALTALGYNTWRNEVSEENRNLRMAGFEILVHIGELQRITYLAHYDRDHVEGNPRRGWVEVMILHDLGRIMPEPLPTRTEKLRDVWQQQWEHLGQNDDAVVQIDLAIDEVRIEVLDHLKMLR